MTEVDDRPRFDLDGWYALGEHCRCFRRRARLEHVIEAMKYRIETLKSEVLSESAFATTVRALGADLAEFAKLRSYWSVPGATKAQAVEAYYQDHPDERP